MKLPDNPFNPSSSWLAARFSLGIDLPIGFTAAVLTVKGQTHFSQSATSTSQKKESHSVTNLKTDNFDKVTVEVAKEHMGLFSTLVSSYDGLLTGQIGNPHLTNEDYSQIDPDDMDRIDIIFNTEKGGEDKACVADIKVIAESSDKSNSEVIKTSPDDLSGSESESRSD
ncbi:hypothetical protein R6Q57_021250 [Mikania cordata]